MKPPIKPRPGYGPDRDKGDIHERLKELESRTADLYAFSGSCDSLFAILSASVGDALNRPSTFTGSLETAGDLHVVASLTGSGDASFGRNLRVAGEIMHSGSVSTFNRYIRINDFDSQTWDASNGSTIISRDLGTMFIQGGLVAGFYADGNLPAQAQTAGNIRAQSDIVAEGSITGSAFRSSTDFYVGGNPLSGTIDAAFKYTRRYNVRDYGAVGDGSTDDYAAISGAYAAVVPGDGGEVFFPPGIYRSRTGLLIKKSNVTFRGNNAEIFFDPALPVTEFTSNCFLIHCGDGIPGDQSARFDITGPIALGATSFVATNAAVAADMAHGLWLNIEERNPIDPNNELVWFDWVQVSGSVVSGTVGVMTPFRTAFPGVHSTVTYKRINNVVENVTVRDLRFRTAITGSSLVIINSNIARQVTLDNCTFTNARGNCISGYRTAEMTVRNCHQRSNKVQSTEFAAIAGLNVHGCTFGTYDAAPDGAQLVIDFGTSFFHFSNNHIGPAANIGAMILYGCHDGTFHNNSFGYVRDAGLTYTLGLLVQGCERVSVTDNVFAGGAGSPSTGITVASVASGSGYAYPLTSRDNVIADNIINGFESPFGPKLSTDLYRRVDESSMEVTGRLLVTGSVMTEGDIRVTTGEIMHSGTVTTLNRYVRINDFDSQTWDSSVTAGSTFISRDLSTMFIGGGLVAGFYSDGNLPAASQAMGNIRAQKDIVAEGSVTASLDVDVKRNLVVTGSAYLGNSIADNHVLNGELFLWDQDTASVFNYSGEADRPTYLRAGRTAGAVHVGDANTGGVNLGSSTNDTTAKGDMTVVGSLTGSGDVSLGRDLAVGRLLNVSTPNSTIPIIRMGRVGGSKLWSLGHDYQSEKLASYWFDGSSAWHGPFMTLDTTGSLYVSGNLNVVGSVTGSSLQLNAGGRVGVFGTAGVAKQTVTGSCGGNTAVKGLLNALAAYGLITDNTTF